MAADATNHQRPNLCRPLKEMLTTPDAGAVDQERIMSIGRIQLIIHYPSIPSHPERFGHLALLFDGEEDVALSAEDKERMVFETREGGCEGGEMGGCGEGGDVRFGDADGRGRRR